MVNINIDVAQIVLVLSVVGILVAVLFFNGTAVRRAYKRLLHLLEVVVEALSTFFRK